MQVTPGVPLLMLALAGGFSFMASASVLPAQGRLRPPPFVTCDRNHLTAFSGKVVSVVRDRDTTTLQMETDEATTEPLRHNPSRSGRARRRDRGSGWCRNRREDGCVRGHRRGTMVAHAIETFGRLDYAVNNAGIEGQFTGDCRSGRRRVGSRDLAPQGIRVNIVCPGFIDTPMHRRLRGVVGDDIDDKVLLPTVHARRAGRPEEIARSIVFLCSDDASDITGTTLTPDGGYTLTI